MKFTQAWSEVLNQNTTLKVGLVVSTVCTLILCVTVVRLAIREPLIVERECVSRTLLPVQTKQTASEIEAFLFQNLSKRFDSDAVDPRNFLGDDEFGYRLKEQEDLSRKGMKQKVFPTTVTVSEKGAVVEADRILSVGGIRSDVPFTLGIQLSSTSRTPGNPYGLLMEKVSQVTKEEKKP